MATKSSNTETNTAGEETAAQGDQWSFAELYQELKAIARNQLSRSVNHGTLSSTVLVNEAYLKLYHHDESRWNDKHHFYCVVAKIVRQIVTDYARKKLSQKRSANDYDVECFMLSGSAKPETELFAIDQAIAELSETNQDMADLVQLRFYAGFTCEEIADMRNVSRSTIQRDWEIAKQQLKKLVASEKEN